MVGGWPLPPVFLTTFLVGTLFAVPNEGLVTGLLYWYRFGVPFCFFLGIAFTFWEKTVRVHAKIK
jgi:hypothetical protein